jgi:hypothetical protein
VAPFVLTDHPFYAAAAPPALPVEKLTRAEQDLFSLYGFPFLIAAIQRSLFWL